MTITWPTLFIATVVITIALLLLGSMWRLLKKLFKVWFIVLVILVIAKLAIDSGILKL